MTNKELLDSLKRFRKDLKEYFVYLPMDLTLTLDDVKSYIERNGKK